MLPPQTRYFPANTGEAPAHPSTWGWWQIHQERAGITLLLHGSAGRRLWLSNCIPTLVKQQSNNVVIFKFKNTSAFLHYDDFCNELRCFCQAQDLHTLCRAPIPVVSPHQRASDPELSCKEKVPLAPSLFLLSLWHVCWGEGSLWYTWNFRWEKTPVNYIPRHNFPWRVRARAPQWISQCWAHILSDRQCLKSFLLSVSCKANN